MTYSIAFRIWLVAMAAAITALMLSPGAASRAGDEPELVFGRGGDIYVRTEAGAVRRLTRTQAQEWTPSWSPDRKRIVYVRARDRRFADLWTMNADGTGARRLAGGAEGGYPRFSPDGKLIVFASTRGEREPELYVMRADGTEVRRLTRTARFVQNTQPSFSPDGRHVVFASNRLGYWNFELFRVRVADGGGLRRLTFWGTGEDGAPGDDISPSYSPDGKRIAFVSDRDGGYAIWTMNASGGDLREVRRMPGYNVVFPRYSRDGTRLVYTALGQAPGTTQGERIWTVAVDGRLPTHIGPGGAADW